MFSITEVIAPTLIIFLLFYIIKYIIYKFREYNMVKKCSGPKAYPLIGNLNMFVGDTKDLTSKIIKTFANYSSPLLLWVGPKLIVFLDDPENIEIILTSSNGYKKNFLYKFLNVILGNGLIAAPGKLYVHMCFLLN
ncbi:hypothetical protein M0804_014636 [Polistes exclamans]|nr:hypothetical protein M0804_014636 [Polistes exclamans]